MKQTTVGLSLVEVLVAVAMLVTVLAISAGILSALGNTRTTAATSQAVNSAQQGAELIRGLWSDPVLYRGACLNRQETPAAERVNWPAGVRMTAVIDLDIMGNVTGNLTSVGVVCAQPSAALAEQTAPPMRQITVVGDGGPEPRTLVITVGRP